MSLKVELSDPATGLAYRAGGSAAADGSSATTPTFQKSVGSGSFATGQVANSISPAAAIQIVPARAGRQAVTLTNVTGSQPTYYLTTAATTGVTTGFFVAGAVGAATTIPTAAAVFSTSPTAAQTISFLETF